MGGTDLKDQILQPYLLERKKGSKWYVKLFKRLLNVAIQNSMIIYRSLSANNKTGPLTLRLHLIKGLIEKHRPGVPCPVYGCPSIEPPPKRLTECHFLEKIPTTKWKSKPQQQCVVCSRQDKRKESIYWCPDCEAGLYLDGCFRSYHTSNLIPGARHVYNMLLLR
jgi:hypothetical protein